MLEPVGPLPPSVYWRRRGVALGSAVLVVVLLGWGIVGLVGGDDGADGATPRARAASFVGPATVSPGAGVPDGPAAGALAAASSAPGIPGSDPRAPSGPGSVSPPGSPLGLPPGSPSGAVLGSSPGAPAGLLGRTDVRDPRASPGFTTPPGGSGAPLLSAGRPSSGADVPAGAAPAGTAPAVPTDTAPVAAPPAPRAASPRPPGPCADAAVRVTARTDKPRYAPGEKPVLSIVVTNVGPVACARDLDAARQAVAVVRKPGDGLWSSNDCAPGRTDDVRVLAPGQDAVFSVRWSVRTSGPGCPARRDPVPAGAYQLLARLDRTISDPVPFILG